MKERLDPNLESQYPKLNVAGYKVTSNKDKVYNCVGWAATRDKEQWWEPLDEPGCFWPKDVPFNHDYKNYIKVFELLGYAICENASIEYGFEKVAIFKDSAGWFTHVSHQLENGNWTSKLGPDEDIEHATAEALESFDYGNVATILKRNRQK